MINKEMGESEKKLYPKENILYDLIIGILLAIMYLLWKIVAV